ncbi:MAG: ferrous iron transport protein B [Candidatus Korarchaeota archaeon]
MESEINVYLVGNPNVGKSVIFNFLTGFNAIVSNYPGTTVSVTSGYTYYKGKKIKVIDLPGVYSLAGAAMDHLVVQKELINAHNGVIINVIDSTNLERDLYLTLQLIERDLPMVILLNMADELKSRGLSINIEELSKILHLPVVLASGIQGWGITKALDLALEVYTRINHARVGGMVHEECNEDQYQRLRHRKRKREGLGWRYEVFNTEKSCHVLNALYPDTVNALIYAISHKLKGICEKTGLTGRAIAVGMIEDNPVVHEILKSTDESLYNIVNNMIKNYERAMDMDAHYSLVISRREIIRNIINKVLIKMSKEELRKERLDRYTTYNPRTAYPILIGVSVCITMTLFFVGGFLEELIGNLLEPLFNALVVYASQGGYWVSTLVEGFLTGILAGLSIAIPYIFIFYIMLAILEDTGYLPRIAYLMDKLMHKVGLHGRAFIPLLVGFGCNVPAVRGTRIMDTERERKISALMASMVPCSARTVVIIGVVGKFVGLLAAIAIYLIAFMVTFPVAKISQKSIKGQSLGLVMEIPPFRTPKPKNVMMKTWIRTKEFINIAFPLLIMGSIIITALTQAGLVELVNLTLSPITVYVLGLPAFLGITLIFGLIRKEMTVELLVVLAGTTNFLEILSPVQLWIFALFITLYFPCIGTFIALWKEYRVKFALAVAIVQIFSALVVAGGFRLLLGALGYS